jgi:hypothetical protein
MAYFSTQRARYEIGGSDEDRATRQADVDAERAARREGREIRLAARMGMTVDEYRAHQAARAGRLD